MRDEFDSLLYLFDKSLRKRLFKAAGRNFLGRICVFHQGGGRTKFYRSVDLHRRLNMFARVLDVFRDSRRTASIAMVIYPNGLVSRILAAEGVFPGSLLYSGPFFPPSSKVPQYFGSAISLHHVTLFTPVSCVELVPGSGAQLCRSAGVAAMLVAKTESHAVLKSHSGWLMKIPLNSMATIGPMSNSGHKYERVPKAGINRQRGIRPTVRGVVKNPCDHPHGGGEGKGSPPAAQLSP